MIETSFPMISPRPTSALSRSTRVIEELQDHLESVQKQAEHLKSQLQQAREVKEHHELENKAYVESNQHIRQDIHKVMQVLESKQRLLDDIKTTHTMNEHKVKQLKEEAMSARRGLEEINRKQAHLARERRTLENLKEKWSQENNQLERSILRHQSENKREIDAEQERLDCLMAETQRIGSLNIMGIVKEKMERRAEERAKVVSELRSVQEKMKDNTRMFIDRAKKELINLLNKVKEDCPVDQVEQCSKEVQALTVKICPLE